MYKQFYCKHTYILLSIWFHELNWTYVSLGKTAKSYGIYSRELKKDEEKKQQQQQHHEWVERSFCFVSL